MRFPEQPEQQGLYDPSFEHDACGIGAVVNIKGSKSHKVVKNALSILVNLEHRGASGSDEMSGDGAGILVQIPHNFFSEAVMRDGITLPERGRYAVGMFFMPRDEEKRRHCRYVFEQAVLQEGQKLLGWRTPPLEEACLGDTARKCMPSIQQAFVECSKNISDNMDFERKLYIIRKQTENTLEREGAEGFYISSLSSRTVVYKGMLLADQVGKFYKDLTHPSFKSAIAMVHSRYSTNTFPSWERAHPNRYMIHNGEINTIRGNVNWINARKSTLKSDFFGSDIDKIHPIVNSDGSDSAMFDNCLEFLHLSGRSLAHAAMMMIPEPWQGDRGMDKKKKDFYEFHSCLMEPWDGPASIVFTDGTVLGAVLDRNGLRPSRYYVTKDGMLVLASEVGVLDIEEEEILVKERLRPGRMLLVDTGSERIIGDEELKMKVASEKPYGKWLEANLKKLSEIKHDEETGEAEKPANLMKMMQAFGYTYEDVNLIIKPMAETGSESIGAMGNDTPIAVLSKKPRLLYDYFKQLFAQVTNPPIDAIREELVTGTEMYLGSQKNLLDAGPESARQIRLETPVLSNSELAAIRGIKEVGFASRTIPIFFSPKNEGKALSYALTKVFEEAEKAVDEGVDILILTDRGADSDKVPIPALLAVSGLHHHLIRRGKRTRTCIVLESGEPREVHHFATLVGYGASAVNPYAAFDIIGENVKKGMIETDSVETANDNYIHAVTKGLLKVISKMGISTLLSYQGAQIFEALGIGGKVIDEYFSGTVSRIGGLSLEDIAKEAVLRHSAAFDILKSGAVLESGGDYKYRSDGEYHMYNPMAIHKLQQACRTGSYDLFKEYSKLFEKGEKATIRSLFEIKPDRSPVPIEEVEPVESIMRRFKTGAMSYGSISREAHEALAIAMNRIGGKSNTGEGGEIADRFIPDPGGDSRNSAIKQVASGRFGVTSHYLVNAKEIQIKMAQGAKPGEGGQLPGRKVYPWIAEARMSTPGVGLISPPPHHDIYSIEDLAQLIHDLKMANSEARINVKLVSETGVGTIAAGVAKGKADVILISGYDGGTGAAPRTSMKHTGLPWELGLAETNQTLILNNLRDRVRLETDGKLMTGRDVIIAAMLGAEEFGFSTAPLVALGCVMMRVCNLDTCPVGIATQDPELRRNFSGKPEYVENFMRFIASEMREYMAEAGFRGIDEIIGRTDLLEMGEERNHFKLKGLRLDSILHMPETAIGRPVHCIRSQDHGIDKSYDKRVLEELLHNSIYKGEKAVAVLPVTNKDRTVGTYVGGKISRIYADRGLMEDTITLYMKGSAGQSFGAFMPKGMTLFLEGDCNDYMGKGLSGGKIVLRCPKEADYRPEENIIAGNVAFYGATGGEAYVNGIAGERFCVRNSGVHAVVEGVGDHGCEYMTGGRVVVLGKTGRNFAAGMSGGIAYVYDATDDFREKVNMEMVLLEKLSKNDEADWLRSMIKKHYSLTGSETAEKLLDRWEDTIEKFVRVIPVDYKRMMETIQNEIKKGRKNEEAELAAFRKHVV